MRTQIIPGFNNNQKFRFILMTATGEEFGMYMTVKQICDQFATTNARVSVWTALAKLADDRRQAKLRGETMPVGLVVAAQGFHQIQVSLDS